MVDEIRQHLLPLLCLFPSACLPALFSPSSLASASVKSTQTRNQEKGKSCTNSSKQKQSPYSVMWAFCIWASLLLVSITYWVYRWRNPKCRGDLPPGSMGFPLLGETIQFFKPNTTSDIPSFIKERTKKYGTIFKTSLVGRPVIVSTEPELSYFVFQQEGRCFQSWYPDTFTEIFGRQNVGSLHGFMYKYLKNMVLTLFGHEGLKKMLPDDI